MEPETKAKIVILAIIVIIIAVMIFISSVVIIGPGLRGVHTQLGRVTGVVYNEGFALKIPFIEGVDVMDIKVNKIETDASAASKDLQIVTSTIAVNYRLKPDNVVWIRQNIGLNFKSVVIDPSIQESVKAATAKFTAEEIITKRELVREQMRINLQEKLDRLTEYSITVTEFNVVNFDFSDEFNKAIEAKQTAEQEALRAKNELERVKYEAQQKIEQAKAEAESIRIQSEQLKENPEILELRLIEKWDGKLPQFLGGSGTGILLNLPFMGGTTSPSSLNSSA